MPVITIIFKIARSFGKYVLGVGILFMAIMPALSQTGVIKGVVVDKGSNDPLSAVSILLYKGGKVSGAITNNEGGFQLSVPEATDSIKFSFIGYRSEKINIHNTPLAPDFLTVKLELEPQELAEVVVKPMSALDIITNAINSTAKLLPVNGYENNFFYREIIRDRENYFSVAEALFKGQFNPAKEDYKLELEKGRSKEDVSYTRLFEDYHPGGGPEALFNNSLVTGFPDFLTLKRLKLFNYHRDSIVRFDDRRIYMISFDQKPGVQEALDKGKVYIDAEDFSIVKYEFRNSPLGMQYVKNLTGTDKLFAELLHIDFKRKGWMKKAEYNKIDGKLYMTHCFAEYEIGYKQVKKDLDLDLTITTEAVCTDQASPVKVPIASDREWKSKDIVANLPTDFDAEFWGNATIISPTAKINNIISNISKKNNEDIGRKIDDAWHYYKRDHFVAYQNLDSITLVPVMKGAWEDDETAGMIYQELTGDFSIETKLSITKRSDPTKLPDNGFQQAGIIVRADSSEKENNLILCTGTAGNDNAKYFLRNTDRGKSKGPIDKIDNLQNWLRIEKQGTMLTAFMRRDEAQEWQKIASYRISWGSKPVQVGFMVMARFAGSGPKMKPDLKAVFSHIGIKTSGQ